MEKKIREAVEQAKIFKDLNHPDREEICGRIIDPLVDLAEQVLSAKMPEKMDVADAKSREDVDGILCYNQAIDECRLATLKPSVGVEDVENAMYKYLNPEDSYDKDSMRMAAESVCELINR